MNLCNRTNFYHLSEKKKSRPESVDCTPPDYIIPGSRERPLMHLQPQNKEQKGPHCIKVLTTSGWNPPPGHRKLHGDLIYLYAVTLEDKRLHITACTRGFYINQSTDEEFNPKPASPNHLSHSLIELLSQVSPAFKRNFTQLQRKRTQRHPFERVATPYQVCCLPFLIYLFSLRNYFECRCIPGLLLWPSIQLMPFGLKMRFRPS